MKRTNLTLKLLIINLIILLNSTIGFATTKEERKNLDSFLMRIGGARAAELIILDVDKKLSQPDKEVYIIGSKEGKPRIVGSTLSATTVGLNFYLNHYAKINLTWNQPKVSFVDYRLPLPLQEEKHTCATPYRYYLNYCTFSYSMSVWTWDRWEREIDWMALHGINMPLQIVGLDVVWYNLLTQHYSYTSNEANEFIAGPCFQAWWGMNNLEGWGGHNPQWWYERQAILAHKILERERSLGMEPVLPGYSGMLPASFSKKTGIPSIEQGTWCGFRRPVIIDPNSKDFKSVSQLYYKELEKQMGKSRFYSIDPFHEGARTNGIDVPAAYRSIRKAMVAANSKAKWVIQQWQWSKSQYEVLKQVEPGRLIVLDLFSDGRYNINNYGNHEVVYCSLPNFGGRTGLFGRIDRIAENWFDALGSKANLKGIGATPEAIEQTPVQYDLLFELPWMTASPDIEKWMNDYSDARYSVINKDARKSWALLRESALNCRSDLQGPHEAVMCGRPSLNVKSVSTWGGSEIFYDSQKVVNAAYLLLDADLDGNNYQYDLIDITRQVLSDLSKSVLNNIKEANLRGDSLAFSKSRDFFLELILDTDRLLSSHPSFMIGEWTEMARDMADESEKATELDADWLEHNNARTLITVWGDRKNSEEGGLHDYSYRQKSGILKDFYYARWRKWFDSDMKYDKWFEFEQDWALNNKTRYPVSPTGDAKKICRELLTKYAPRM